MKKIISVLLCLLLMTSLGIAVYANSVDLEHYKSVYEKDFSKALQDAGYTEAEIASSVPVYTVRKWEAHAWDYDAVLEDILLNRQKTAGIVQKDGETLFLLASKSNGVWSTTVDEASQEALAAVNAQYGNDFLFLPKGYVVLAVQPDTLYEIEQFTKEQTALTPYSFTLSQYAKAAARLAMHKPIYDENEDIVLGINDYSVAYAEEYWDYWENKELRDRQFAIRFFTVVGLFAAGLITLFIVVCKKGKLHLNLPFTRTIWNRHKPLE